VSQRSARVRALGVRTLAVAAAIVLLPAPLVGASAAPQAASGSTAEACAITGGTLTWGFKESFRSYISGSIANGSWEPVDGATYTTPDFGWSGATGTVDPETLVGDVHFPGGVRFTGHDGLLDSTIANPTLSFAGDGTGRLLLDVRSLPMADAMAGDTDAVQVLTQVPFVTLDLSTVAPQPAGDEVVIAGSAVPTAITDEGFAAFGNYDVGTAFDPATFSVTVACAAPEPEPAVTDDTTTAATPVPAASDEPADLGWLAWVGGAVALAAAAGLVTWLVRRSRGGSSDGGDAPSRGGDA
jgi:hypothetical protein